jgi:hypothetical protein
MGRHRVYQRGTHSDLFYASRIRCFPARLRRTLTFAQVIRSWLAAPARTNFSQPFFQFLLAHPPFPFVSLHSTNAFSPWGFLMPCTVVRFPATASFSSSSPMYMYFKLRPSKTFFSGGGLARCRHTFILAELPTA